MRSPRPTEAAMRRVITAWKEAGLSVGQMEVTPEGRIIISATPPAENTTAAPAPGAPRQWRKQP